MSIPLDTITNFLEQFAPLELAEDWDNVGLLLGDVQQPISKVMTCLTLTPDVATEAIDHGADLIITHHPIMFRPVKQLTNRSTQGDMILKLIRNNIAVYSPHTAFDSAQDGINNQLAVALGLTFVEPLRPTQNPHLGGGRHGVLEIAETLAELLVDVKSALNIPHLQFVGSLDQHISKVAIACGAAGEFLKDAQKLGCELLITGETRFHTCLEARESNTAMILLGHYQSERPALETFVHVLEKQFQELHVWASTVESDPVQWSIT